MDIRLAKIREFGFEREKDFPKLLDHQQITLNLPEALNQNIPSFTVEVEYGLMVPTLRGDHYYGAITIKEDGAILYFRKDDNEPLGWEAEFIKEVPYDVRKFVFGTMQRAVLADIFLDKVWRSIRQAWEAMFPLDPYETQRQDIGVYDDVQQMWQALYGVYIQFVRQSELKIHQSQWVEIQCVVQQQEEFVRGWKGLEYVVDRNSFWRIREDIQKYLVDRLGKRLKDVLANPSFPPDSRFKLYLEHRMSPTFNIVLET